MREKATERATECETEGACKSGVYIEQKSKSAGDRLAGSTTEDTIERQTEGRESEHERARERESEIVREREHPRAAVSRREILSQKESTRWREIARRRESKRDGRE